MENIVNILSGLLVKSGLISRKDPFLRDEHMHNSAAVEKQDVVFLHTYEGKLRLFSLKYDDNIVRTSRYPIAEFVNTPPTYCLSSIHLGILIFTKYDRKGESLLFDPCRGEVLMLPPATVLPSPHQYESVPKHFCFGFGFDSTTNAYKVVRVFTGNVQGDPQDYVAQVYTLGTKSWRQISSVLPYRVDSLLPVSAYGDTHWMVSCAVPEGSAESMIISFDFKIEEFKLTPHPDFSCKKYKYFHLVDLRGSLAIVDLSPTTHMEIWVLKDYGGKDWAQEYRISIEELHCQVPRFRQHNTRVVGAWDEGILFEVFKEGLLSEAYIDGSLYHFSIGSYFYCNLKTGSLGVLDRGFPYQLSSVSCSYRRSPISLRNYGGNLMVKKVGTENCFDFATIQ